MHNKILEQKKFCTNCLLWSIGIWPAQVHLESDQQTCVCAWIIGRLTG